MSKVRECPNCRTIVYDYHQQYCPKCDEELPDSKQTSPEFDLEFDESVSGESMYAHIGVKIMTLAKATAWIGIIGSLIGGLLVMGIGSQMSYGKNPMIFPGVLIMLLGSLGAWIGSFTLYGFGQLIEHAATIESLAKETNTLLRG